jgi:hypothetical protein
MSKVDEYYSLYYAHRTKSMSKVSYARMTELWASMTEDERALVNKRFILHITD